MRDANDLPAPDELALWVIYNHPRDYPKSWVVRCQFVGPRGIRFGSATLCGSLEQARRLIPPGLVQMMPQPGEDPVIAETWV